MALYEVTIVGYKRFAVEAGSQDEAVSNDLVSREMLDISGEVDWEGEEANATRLPDNETRADIARHMPVFDLD